MRPTLPVQRLVPVVLLAILVVAFIAIAAGRLGGGGESDNANQVIQRAFGGDAAQSGRFEATVQASIEGGPASQSGDFKISVNGAFDRAPKGKAPELDVDMVAEGAGSPVRFGVVSTGEKGFLMLAGRTYALPASQFEQTFSARNDDESAALAALGIDPRSWLENVQDRGDATVAGVATDHVSASVNTDKLVNDLFRVASRSGGGAGVPQVSESDRKQAEDSIKSATLDVYASKSDGSLRRLSANVEFSSEQGSGRVSLDMTLSDLGKPQRIEAPSGARPLAELRSADALSLFGGLGGAGSGSSPSGGSAGGSAGSNGSAGSAGSAGGGSAGGAASDGGAGSVPLPAQKYLDCVAKARTPAQIQACLPLLG